MFGLSHRLFALAPLLISLAAFLLALLTLLAGYKPGFMADTHIVVLDTSGLGRSLLPLARAKPKPKPKPKPRVRGGNRGDEAEDEDEPNDNADGVTDALGVDRFYALHAMTVCSGQYANGNDLASGLAARRCTRPFAELDVLQVMDLDLRIPGPVRAVIADLANAAPKIFRAMAGLFVTGVVLAGAATLGALAAALLPARARLLAVLNVAVLSLAAVMLLCGTLLTPSGATSWPASSRTRAAASGCGRRRAPSLGGLVGPPLCSPCSPP